VSGSERTAAALSRALVMGATLGTIPLMQIGCAPQAVAPVPAVAAPIVSEEEYCRRALATSSVADAEALLRAYPAGRCIGPVLSALPRETLAQISPATLQALPAETRASIPPSSAVHLRVPRTPDVQPQIAVADIGPPS
jgi:hypothetical protein